MSLKGDVSLKTHFTSSFERVVVGKFVRDSDVMTNEEDTKRRRVEHGQLWSLGHEVKQLSGKKTGVSCSVCDHTCVLRSIPFIVSTVSYHSRKPNCELFSFLFVIRLSFE